MFTLAAAALVGLVVVAPLIAFVWILWHLCGRPLAVSVGFINPTADDFVVRGWKAERGGQWAVALAAYDKARTLSHWDGAVIARRTDLVQRCPDLVGEADRAEREWLATLDPLELLDHQEGVLSGRKLRLAAVACCRRVWHLLNDRSRSAVEAAEKHADHPLPPEEKLTIVEAAYEAMGTLDEGAELDAARDARAAAAMSLASLTLWMDAQYGTMEVFRLTASSIGRHEQIRLLDCIFGLPYRTREAIPSWHTSTVIALASGIYDENAFDRMPILADALMDSGCENEEMLNHCRGESAHVRGCWVVDLLLGKE